VLAALLLYQRFAAPSPLVHSLQLGGQAAPAAVRQPGESPIYRSWATGQGTPLQVRPAGGVKSVDAAARAPPPSVLPGKPLPPIKQRYILDTPVSLLFLIQLTPADPRRARRGRAPRAPRTARAVPGPRERRRHPHRGAPPARADDLAPDPPPRARQRAPPPPRHPRPPAPPPGRPEREGPPGARRGRRARLRRRRPRCPPQEHAGPPRRRPRGQGVPPRQAVGGALGRGRGRRRARAAREHLVRRLRLVLRPPWRGPLRHAHGETPPDYPDTRR
jgi:hypothetical protein